MAKTMKKKRFDEGGVLRTRSDDEIGDTDPRTGIVTPGSFDRRRAQGEKNLQAFKSFFGMGSAKPSADVDQGSVPTASTYFDRRREAPTPALVSPAADSAMNQSIREAISKRPTSMSPNTSQGQDRSVTPSVIPSSPANPPAPKKKPPTPKPSVQPSKGGSGGGRGPTAQQLQDYAKQKDAQRKADYDKANKEAATPAGKAKRSEREKAEAIVTDTDVMPIPGGSAISAAAKLAKKLAQMGKKAKSTAPFMKEIGNEPLKLGMNRGGSVKKMASGGLTGNASKRADGIAQRGRTKCKTY
jgi:hypothetical protein